MNSFQTTWEDETCNRLVEFSIQYTVEDSRVNVAAVTPTQVAFIGEAKEVERTIGVHTAKGQEMLADQFTASGNLETAITAIAEKEGLLERV